MFMLQPVGGGAVSNQMSIDYIIPDPKMVQLLQHFEEEKEELNY